MSRPIYKALNDFDPVHDDAGTSWSPGLKEVQAWFTYRKLARHLPAVIRNATRARFVIERRPNPQSPQISVKADRFVELVCSLGEERVPRKGWLRPPPGRKRFKRSPDRWKPHWIARRILYADAIEELAQVSLVKVRDDYGQRAYVLTPYGHRSGFLPPTIHTTAGPPAVGSLIRNKGET